MEKGSCCPHGSWPRLQVNYQAKGDRFEVANTTCYHVGQGNKVIFMVSDIFGATSGQHESFADTFASFGYNVYLPQLLTNPYDGPMEWAPIMESIKNQDHAKVRERFLGVSKYLEQHGHKRFFVLAFCWGVWWAFKMSTQVDNIIAIGGMHPSLGLEQFFGGDVNQLTKKVQAPTFMYPAGNDPADVKPHGQVIKILQQKFGADKVGSHQFHEMTHGWTTRGDISDDKVKRDVTEAIHLCKDYFAKFQ